MFSEYRVIFIIKFHHFYGKKLNSCNQPEHTFDISADLQELAHTNVTVVCAGAKSILDLGLTTEYLETFGVPLIGYTTWGPIDLVSAGTGQYAKRYGFIYVDRHDDGTGDFSRSKKDSFYWYKKVCESNGEEI